MKLKIFIKEPQKEFLDGIVKEYSSGNCEEAIKVLLKFASIDNQQSNDDFFDTRCVGYCFAPVIPVSIDISTDEVEYLKRMIEQYDFEDYDTEEETLGKAVRCLINYADQDGDQKSIFTNINSSMR